MLIYSGKKSEFRDDVINNIIADKIEEKFKEHNFNHHNDAEFRSWENSLRCMNDVLTDKEISDDCYVAIEYQIPTTSKRVDFIITGKDDRNESHAVIIELKQWESSEVTSREDIVTTYVGGAIRAVVHPSYQAYSYAKTIESFNETVRQNNVSLIPCAFLHNYSEDKRGNIEHDVYKEAIRLAPVFLKRDFAKLREFIKKYVKHTDNGDLLYMIDNGKIKPSKALQDALSSMLHGNQEFYMIDEQKVAYETIKKLVFNRLNNSKYADKKYTVVIQGGPGTGKSVIAINLLCDLLNNGFICNYVTKNAAPRNVYFSKLKQDNFKKVYVSNLFKGSGVYVDSKSNEIDCLLVDEAHRLNAKSGIFQNKGENQIKEIINAAKVSVFFIDEDQIVTTKDIGSVAEIEKWAKFYNSEVISGEDFILKSQFRCNGSDGYINFLDNLFEIKQTANLSLEDLDYDFKVFDDPNELRETIKEKNKINNKARMLAGYCYEWVSKNKPKEDIYDICLENDFKAKWNFSSTNTWAIDEDSIDEVGCIHTSQGLEFDYVGVIIGKDLICRNGHIITDANQRAHSDQSLRNYKKLGGDYLADRIIKNTYKTLLSRGQKGCYVYCEDKELSERIKSLIK